MGWGGNGSMVAPPIVNFGGGNAEKLVDYIYCQFFMAFMLG